MSLFTVKTRVYSGADSLAWLRTLHGKKIWIVCDGFLAGSPNLKMVTDNIHEDNTVGLFSDIIPDPPIATVAAGIEAMSAIQPDVVIGFGGGSALDSAKAIIFFGRKLGIMVENFVAIPTTSGTGSEVTSASVISDPASRIKYPLFDDSLYPDIALLEPRLVLSVPPAVTANTGLDVLTHALEAYVAKGATDFTDALAEKAAQLVISFLPVVYRDGNELEARTRMHNASTLAGIAFSQAGLGMNHAIAHQLGGQLHIPHGLANALLLCHVIRFNSRDLAVRAKYARLSKLCGLANFHSADEYCVASLITHLHNLMKQVNVADNLSALNITREQVTTAENAMITAALQDACLSTNPVTVSDTDIRAILRAII
ncbi:1-propanol dehydrogenase PduQ [Klebsiella sp. S69]|uniref:1-propanol dehydrogenase PduQ n=1 Tax=Klebsiella sp. S69 TaxID=2767439 RepID=UPI001903E7D9|nr:1-propanol dehydrogenase PduQ [Klebsiella sp. S69]MBK0162400.1 iron-containing alcohol dehydrogenase [Klebsiella sp. S69]